MKVVKGHHDVGQRHQFKHPIDMPHARDLGRNKTPTFEVTASHHYRESNTHRSDLSEMVGPIYNKAAGRHQYTGGYVTPRPESAERQQLEKQKALVGQFFKQETKSRSKSADTRYEQKSQSSTTTTMQQQQSSQQVTMQGRETQILEAKKSGLERKQEALKRREEFVSTSTTQVDGTKVLSTQEINAKREEMIKTEVLKIQQESKMMMERYMLECKRRNEMIEQEQQLRQDEEKRKQDLLQQRNEEREAKEKASKEELKKQEALLKQEHLKAEEEERRRKAEAERKEQQMLKMQQEKQNVLQKQSGQSQKDAERREYEKQQMEARRAEEEMRRREMDRLENLKNKEQQTIMRQQTEMKSMQNVDLTYRSPGDQRPGDLTGFGFGSVRTGQVSSRKIEILTRAASEERGGLNPEVSYLDGSQSRSARASPLPQMSILKFQDQTIDDLQAPKTVQWAQQSAAIAKTDFASSTKALGSGLVRSSKSATASSALAASASKSESHSSSKASFIQESATSFATQSKMEFSSSSSKSSASSFQVSKQSK
jgi:hypothetical protein